MGLLLLSHEGVSTPQRSLLDFEVLQESLCFPISTSRRPLEGQRGGGGERNFRGDEEGKAAAPVPEVGKESRKKKKPLRRQIQPGSPAKERRSGILFLGLVCKYWLSFSSEGGGWVGVGIMDT